MITIAKCDAYGMLVRHFEDMYGPLGRANTDRLARAEWGVRRELDDRCRRRTLLKSARHEASAARGRAERVSRQSVSATER